MWGHPALTVDRGIQKMLTLQKAIKQLEAEYEKARKLDFVRNPLAYALYKVWKVANAEPSKEET